MSINWNFNAEDYEENSFKPIPEGDHRVRIEAAEEQTSSGGNPMIKLTLGVSGYSSTIWHYVVLLADNKKITNQRLGELFDSFSMAPNFNLASWVGKVGAARIKHEMYQGEPRPKVAYFIAKSRQDKLPPWKETAQVSAVTGATATQPAPTMTDISPDELPWK